MEILAQLSSSLQFTLFCNLLDRCAARQLCTHLAAFDLIVVCQENERLSVDPAQPAGRKLLPFTSLALPLSVPSIPLSAAALPPAASPPSPGEPSPSGSPILPVRHPHAVPLALPELDRIL